MKYPIADILEYIVIVVSEFAQRFRLSQGQAYRYISQHGGVQLIENHYGIMHTLDFGEVVDSLAAYCARKGGELR